MYDKELVIDILQHIEETIQTLIEGTRHIENVNELLSSATGVLILDGICMKLLVIGEEVKNLDKHSNKTLLTKYPAISWRKIMGMRDIIAHHYFEVDADKVFDVLRNNIPPLLTAVRQIKAAL
ncbi:MAG: DUF86 domain-containing protein [Tannerella sp.]|jgi:uncharacterized protein with HEPN domain|nr:DUF86 domain-containing protein [Tannerella sp.]